MFSDLEKKMRVLHILVNNASVFDRGTLEESTAELWDAQMDSNARAPFFVAQKAARLILLQPQGKIVNLVDVAGETIWPGYFAYSVSKAALIAVNRGLRKVLAPEIQVTVLRRVPFFSEHYTEEQKSLAIERTLLKRAGSPSDIVNAIVFLLRTITSPEKFFTSMVGRHIMYPLCQATSFRHFCNPAPDVSLRGKTQLTCLRAKCRVRGAVAKIQKNSEKKGNENEQGRVD
jgi:NAD(P)-dependent dehydrogenase (short-subunit alcohol dehydrogenase family)